MIRQIVVEDLVCVLYCIVVDTNMVVSGTFSKYLIRTILYTHE